MSLNETKLNDVYTNWLTAGIFSDLQNFDVPWKDLNISFSLDLAYHGNHSGNKIISPLLERLMANNSDPTVLTEEQRAQIANVIFTVCGTNWTKLYNTLNLEYNPIENVDAYLTETTDNTGNRNTTDQIKSTGTDTRVASGSDSVASTGTDTTENTGTVGTSGTSGTDRTTENGIAGFNSSDYSQADNQKVNENITVSNTETRNTKDTETKDLTDTTTYGRTDTETKDLTDDHTGTETTTGKTEHTLHRHGNIGVTTSQQMVTAERELWNWFFYDVVFTDIDKYLTISVY